METMNRRPEEFDSPTDPRFLALVQAGAHTDKELTEGDIKQEWRREMGSVQYSVFGIVVNDHIQYFGSKRDESKQKISSYEGDGLAKDVLKTLDGTDAENPRLSIDEINQELVITIPGEPSIRIPEKGEPSSN
jgi:hypothetical protein